MSEESKLRVTINEWGKYETPSVLLRIREGETEISLEEVEDVARHVLGMYEENAHLHRALERSCTDIAIEKPHISSDVEWWMRYYMEEKNG